MKNRLLLFLALIALIPFTGLGQEDNPFIVYDVPSQNLLKFNRFLINPTFSTAREDKSYVNLLHRNQSVSFDDNNQSYFLSYSGRIGDRSGAGLSIYTQREGTLSNYGILANYAYGVKLSDKSNFTFGANLSYYNSGFDESRANPLVFDPFLSGFQDSSLLTFQPGFNISYDAFDFGVYAENLFDYNLKTSESLTSFSEKTFSSHLQYTHQFGTNRGVLEGGRLMPLARARRVGEDEFVFGGNLILDLPKIGWLQGGYDSFYGASAGVGFNLNQRLSIGYTMEKGLSNNFDNFGLTHEISVAFSFTPNLTEDRVMLEDDYEDLVQNESPDSTDEGYKSEETSEIAELRKRLAENDAILAELMFRQDSMEQSRESELENRFERVMRMVRQETGGSRPDLEDKAESLYYQNNNPRTLAGQTSQAKEVADPAVSGGLAASTSAAAASSSSSVQTSKPTATATSTEVAATSPEVITSESPIKQRRFRNLPGVMDGYYIVANVYSGTKYMDNFMDELKTRGFDPEFIDNKENGLKYVYLKRFENWSGAENAAITGFDGNYGGTLWVMNVANQYTNMEYAENSAKIKAKATKYDNNVLRKNVIDRDQLNTVNTPEKELAVYGAGTEYYIIANVFSKPGNATRFVRFLNSKGMNASYFINPENNYFYVYLKRHENWNSALISYYSKLNDSYDDKMWIMRVRPGQLT
ncbi:MAG: type IX secretion system membrane protein PorP/SprF [Robiginitalea sp.]|uniref:PorP/SprF family type IX secretion system membrane protein n=1 Tax=Robiginitalea sp. TaxID=1902411 RepID=UPI003C72F6C0